ncbi:hypothetical protein [Streptomyces sp. NPDC051183]|uniref:hypothetical protein n=1 Tax=Streptomyces sp. NPDC051183 TaxID=3155165 RepID=UPI00343DCEF2
MLEPVGLLGLELHVVLADEVVVDLLVADGLAVAPGCGDERAHGVEVAGVRGVNMAPPPRPVSSMDPAGRPLWERTAW